MDITRSDARGLTGKTDELTIEEPLEIILKIGHQQHRLTLTMRTPGNDFDLATGLLYCEGIIERADQVVDMTYRGPRVGRLQIHNTLVVEVQSGPHQSLDRLYRNFVAHAGCGICGKSGLDALVLPRQPQLSTREWTLDNDVVLALPAKLREAQFQFIRTGGIHAAALVSSKGQILGVREDIGRHNALDKLIGSHLVSNPDGLADGVILVSGRAGFELVQKTLMAHVPVLISVGAPSSLAVELAVEHDLTLIGFISPDGFNIYHPGSRLVI